MCLKKFTFPCNSVGGPKAEPWLIVMSTKQMQMPFWILLKGLKKFIGKVILGPTIFVKINVYNVKHQEGVRFVVCVYV